MLELMRFDSICGGVQKFLEEMLAMWISNTVQKTKIKKIGLAVGMFTNLKAYQPIMWHPEVEEILFRPSCGLNGRA